MIRNIMTYHWNVNFSAIKEGNKEKVIQYAYSFPQEDSAISSKGDQLRNQKIMALSPLR